MESYYEIVKAGVYEVVQIQERGYSLGVDEPAEMACKKTTAYFVNLHSAHFGRTTEGKFATKEEAEKFVAEKKAEIEAFRLRVSEKRPATLENAAAWLRKKYRGHGKKEFRQRIEAGEFYDDEEEEFARLLKQAGKLNF